MKRLVYLLSGICGIALLVSCEKNALHSVETTAVESQPQLKVMYFSAYRANPLYQIKVNDTRVSNTLGGSSNPTPFPGGGLNTGGGSTPDYLFIPQLTSTIAIATPKVGTNTDSVQLASAPLALENAKMYSLYFTDTAANTTTVLVQDSLARPDSGYAKYKFINLMPDLPALDLYIGTVKVVSNIPYKGVSPSFILPTNNASTTWAIRTVGGTTNLTTYASASTLTNQRVYSVVARGYNSITATTDFRRRSISLIYNR